jgi:hypothetical protein
MGGFYQNDGRCQEGMRPKIPSEGETLKGLLKILSMCYDFVEVKSFPANPILPTPGGKKAEFLFSKCSVKVLQITLSALTLIQR